MSRTGLSAIVAGFTFVSSADSATVRLKADATSVASATVRLKADAPSVASATVRLKADAPTAMEAVANNGLPNA